MKIEKAVRPLKYEDATEVFSKLYKKFEYKFLLESKEVSHVYGRLSLLGVDPALEVAGKNDGFVIKALNDRGKAFLAAIDDVELEICDYFERSEEAIKGVIEKAEGDFEESERTNRKNSAQILKVLLAKFGMEERELVGLYGAFAYDFARLFEDLPDELEDEGVADFRLQLYDTFVFFDHLKSNAEVIVYRENQLQANVAAEFLEREVMRSHSERGEFTVGEAAFDLGKEEYMDLVENARDLARRGELFEVVYSNTLRADFDGDAFELYKKYAAINPSPYLFYFDFGDEQLVGASPEMMVRYENGKVELRPISGTAKRGADPIEDHENMLELLMNEKERSELDMLIDLGRNDLSRICQPGIEIKDYRFVEKYSSVMHTVAHLMGDLRPGFSGFDALISCLNAGTLTGAPKVAAMEYIEKNENSRRGYYGGAIGYLALSGEVNTGITIRTAHIKNGRLSFRVGATLLYDSDPAAEYQEILNKAGAFLKAIDVKQMAYV